jgi:hypothetical protein
MLCVATDFAAVYQRSSCSSDSQDCPSLCPRAKLCPLAFAVGEQLPAPLVELTLLPQLRDALLDDGFWNERHDDHRVPPRLGFGQ